MNDNKLDRVICIGCLTGNPFRCRSFAGAAPRHATDYDDFQKKSAKFRVNERRKEEEELVRETLSSSGKTARA